MNPGFREKLRQLRGRHVLLLILAAGLYVLIVHPMLLMLINSVYGFLDGQTRPSLENYARLVSEPRIRSAIANSLLIGFGTSLLSAVVGTTLAWLVTRTDMPLKKHFRILNLVPFFMSPFVGALAWRVLAAPNSGTLNRIWLSIPGAERPLFDIYSMAGIIWVLALFYTPYVYLFAIGTLQRMNQQLEEAARMSGASLRAIVTRITLPLSAPAILFGTLITFITSVGIFDVPILLGVPAGINTIPTQIAEELNFPADFGITAAVGSFLLVLTALGVLAITKYIKGRDFVTVGGRGFDGSVLKIGRLRYVGLGFQLGYILIAVAIPMIALLMVSVSTFWDGTLNLNRLTLTNYERVLFHYPLALRALRNSFILATVGATVGAALAFVVAYVVTRSRLLGRQVIDYVSMFPVGIPGIVFALGVLLMWIKSPLYGTLGILLLAYVGRFIPFAIRILQSSFLSLHPELEEAGKVAGATWHQILRRVLIPLTMPGLVSAWIILFIVFVRELSVTVLLWQPGTEVLSIALLTASRERLVGDVAALGVVQTVILLVAVWLFMRVTRVEDFSL